MSEELTLLPCPACKRHSAGITRTNGTGVAFVMCRRIGCALSGPIRKTDEAAVAAWNALPRALTWTDNRPQVPGWYWFKGEYGIRIAWIKHDSRKMNELYAVIGGVGNWMSTLHGQWAGPITEPQEPKGE